MSISRNFLQTPSLDDILLGNFTFSGSVIFVEDTITWRRNFEIFWLTTMLVILKIKILPVSVKKFLYQCHPPYTKRVSLHMMLYVYLFGSYNMCIIYLHVIETCLKVTIAMFYFCHLKNSSNLMINDFNSISMYFWKKNALFNKYKKQMCYKENKSIFWRHEKWPEFLLQKFFIFNVITDCFLVQKLRTLEHARKYICKILRNLDCQDSICFGIFQVV